MWDSRRSAAEGRLGAVAGEARWGLYRGEPCGPRLARVAGQFVGLSTFHFARAFKRTFGQPPHRYYVSRRIEGAKALLAARGHSVTDVALALGFSETSAFASAFRKATGLTPSEYRRGHR